MNRINIIGKTKPIEVPSAWSELTPAQIRFVYMQYYYLLRHQSYDLWFDRLLCEFLPVKTRFLRFTKGSTKKEYNALQVARILFDFLLKYDGERLNFTFRETTNHLPEIKSRFMTFRGPEELLFDLTLEEFQAALAEQSDIISGDTDAVNRFCAILYHPIRDGKREKFNPDALEAHAKAFAKVPEWQKQMITHWFGNCINHIQTRDITIGSNTLNFSPLFRGGEDEGGKKKNSLGWQGVVFDIAEKGVFGTAEQTAKQNLYDILMILLNEDNKSKELKKRV